MNVDNPYYVLGLGPDATPGEIEREGRKLLALIEVGAERGRSYESPMGKRPCDATLVREAIAKLRDPKERLRQGLLVRLVALSDEERQVVAERGFRAEQNAALDDAYEIAGFKGL